ncbi:uncharacterized protein LOC116140590 [Pistacia vera]|uniref:uncharacterized protein LOC116140590 n=1 Tax=Pistacia vera TaxID=55513 RepID=UPI0012631E7A|nr:uncharacterized protein LOC116140590 [Pistacia vera]
MSDFLKLEDLVKELQIDIDKTLEPELDARQCCIYRVPKDLRSVNEEAYTPQLVSIGPLHHGKEELGLELRRLTPQVVVKHLTDWRRTTMLEHYERSKQMNGWIDDLPCAVQLHESGVKFKCLEGEHSLIDIILEKRKQRIPCFEVYELQLPRLGICDDSESLLRNVMALEQCHYPRDAHVCNYVRLMDYLINTEKDVDLLVGNGIISNQMGDNDSIANMFNRLSVSINLSKSSYYDICVKLKQHCDNPWNRTKSTLKRVYFNNLWRGTATVAAVLLLLLTIIQTMCSILQVVFM